MAKKAETIKLTEEEIKVFTDTTETVNKVSMELGSIEITLNNLDRQLEALSGRKEQLLELYKETLQNQQQHTQSLVEKYGQGNLNTETWEFIPNS